jgi:hypothetical protein
VSDGQNGQGSPGPVAAVVPPSATFDAGNSLLAERPAAITTSHLAMPGHPERVCLTIRTETTTLTLLLAKADALSWAAQLKTEAGQLSGSGLITR